VKLWLTDLTPSQIAERLSLKPFQGRQIFRWIHRRRVFDFDAMTDLSLALRQRLEETCTARQLTLAQMGESGRTPTKKALFRLADGETVEAVFLQDRDRVTLCVSCQVGCPLGCAFCATGHGGYKRNLRPGEIVEQVLLLLAGVDIQGRTPNVVFMGMGEPFLNYDAVVQSIRLLMDKQGLGIGARKITVSTVGEVAGIYRFAKEGWQVRLAVSLHAANDRLRSRLVPLNRKYPLDKLMESVRHYVKVTGRHVSFEWVLLKDVNDSAEHAQELVGLLDGLDATVNLIVYNRVGELPYESPNPQTCKAFLQALVHRGIKATLRQERGQDIDAACGQLRLRNG